MDFKVDNLHFTSHDPYYSPKRLWLTPSQFTEGAKYAKENNINNFFLYRGNEDLPSKVHLDLSWLLQFPDTYYLEIMLHPSKKSNLDALYALKNLQYLVYFGYNDIPLDHTRLPSLKSLYTHYSATQLEGNHLFSLLPNLQRLKLWHIKKQPDCHFLGILPTVTKLELTWSKSLETLSGIENLPVLETISTERCSSLKDVNALLQCNNLLSAWLGTSKLLDLTALTQLKQNGIQIGGPPGSPASKI